MAAPVPPTSPRDALKKWFGFDDFRHQQSQVVQAALAGRDSAVFWATGNGKSLCYQLPALASGRTVYVVSPLISLMHDQVLKLNATAGRGRTKLACYLGSAQLDPAVEERALAGSYALVYVTPEKLATGFLERLAERHRQSPIMMLAVDEAHCVSEWGHDFRPDYRNLSRFRQLLPDVPIMALTATAMPRVRSDIIASLGLREPLVSAQTIFRANLALSCERRAGSGVAELSRLRSELARYAGQGGARAVPSTIVYAPTQAAVESVGQYLGQEPALDGMVEIYHGGLAPAARSTAHERFLSGAAPIVAATVAFGMGIDKPDIRRVYHFGAPKTVEEYYQQIGRAGRDGNLSSCVLMATDSDFSRYKSDFYLGGLSADGRSAVEGSIDLLRQYHGYRQMCRWTQLGRIFDEQPDIGRCGKCDVCTASADDLIERNYAAEAKLLLLGLRTLGRTAPWSQLKDAIKPTSKIAMLGLARSELKPKRTDEQLREFLGPLTQRCALSRVEKLGAYAAYDLYTITAQGEQLFASLARGDSLMLPSPPLLLRLEREAKERHEARIAELEASGVSRAIIPETELADDTNEGPAVRAALQWVRKRAQLREMGRAERADALEALHDEIVKWRGDAAVRMHIAPVSIVPDYLIYNLCHVLPDTVDAINSVGVRTTDEGAAQLANLIRKWKVEHLGAAAGGKSGGNGGEGQMRLPAGVWLPPHKWSRAKPTNPAKPPAWQKSYERFTGGESLASIAMTQASGKPIQVRTVAGHILQAVEYALPIDLARLNHESGSPLPNREEWLKMEEAEAALSIDVATGDAAKAPLASYLIPALAKPFDERTESDKAAGAACYERLAWYMAFRRIGYTPEFGSDEHSATRTAVKRPIEVV